jgi:hypothetical protein
MAADGVGSSLSLLPHAMSAKSGMSNEAMFILQFIIFLLQSEGMPGMI